MAAMAFILPILHRRLRLGLGAENSAGLSVDRELKIHEVLGRIEVRSVSLNDQYWLCLKSVLQGRLGRYARRSDGQIENLYRKAPHRAIECCRPPQGYPDYPPLPVGKRPWGKFTGFPVIR